MKAFLKIFFTLLFLIFTAINSPEAVEAFSTFIQPQNNLEIVSKDFEETKDSYITNVSKQKFSLLILAVQQL